MATKGVRTVWAGAVHGGRRGGSRGQGGGGEGGGEEGRGRHRRAGGGDQARGGDRAEKVLLPVPGDQDEDFTQIIIITSHTGQSERRSGVSSLLARQLSALLAPKTGHFFHQNMAAMNEDD